MERVDPELLQMLACPVTGGPLPPGRRFAGVAQAGARYPDDRGRARPLLGRRSVEQTLHVARGRSLDVAKGVARHRRTPARLEPLLWKRLGISDDQKDLSARILQTPEWQQDRGDLEHSKSRRRLAMPYVTHLITGRRLFRHSDFRDFLSPPGNGATAAGRRVQLGAAGASLPRGAGYRPVGTTRRWGPS